MTERALLGLLCLLLAASDGVSQDIPKLTNERADHVTKLIRACMVGGGLRYEKRKDEKRLILTHVDQHKIHATMKLRKDSLGIETRDALLASWFRVNPDTQTVISLLLRELGILTKDDQALGLASFLSARKSEQEGRTKEAIPAYRNAVHYFQKRGAISWQALSLNNLGYVLKLGGSLAEAEGSHKQALEIYHKLYPKEKYPQGHPLLAVSLSYLAHVFQSRGSLAEAEGSHKQALEIYHKLYPKEKYPQGHPLLAVSLSSLAHVFQSRGLLEKAEGYFKQALEMRQKLYPKDKYPQGHPDLATTLSNLGLVSHAHASFEEAEGYFKQALEMRQKLYPKDKYPQGHPDLARSLHNLGLVFHAHGSLEEAEAYSKQALEMTQKLYPKDKYPQGHPDLATTLSNLGLVFHAHGSLEEAEAYSKQALEMTQKLYPKDKYPQGHPDLATTLSNLGLVSHAHASFEEAEGYFKQALEMTQKLYPKDKYPQGHPDLARSLHNLGLVFHAHGSLEEAEGYFKQALEMRQKLYPKDKYPQGHPDLATTLSNLGIVLQAGDSLEEAVGYSKQALEIYRKLYPKENHPQGHPLLAASLNNLGYVLRLRGSLEEAQGYYKQALEMCRKLYPKDKYPQGHIDLAGSLNNLGVVLQAHGSLEEAEAYYKQALEMRQKFYSKVKYPKGHSNLAAILDNLGIVLKLSGSLEEAEAYSKQALEIRQKLYPKDKYPKGHPDLAVSLANLAHVLLSRGLLEEAEGYFKQALEMTQKLYPKDKYPQGHPDLARSLHNLGYVLRARGSLEEAEAYFKQALEMTQKLYPKDKYPQGHPNLGRTLTNLGIVLQRRGSIEEAIRLHEGAIQTLKVSEAPFDYTQGVQALGRLRALPMTAQILYNRAYALGLGNRGSTPTHLRSLEQAFALASAMYERLRGEVLRRSADKIREGEQAYEIVPLRVGLLRHLFATERKAQDLDRAFRVLEAERAQVHLESVGRANAGRLAKLPTKLYQREQSFFLKIRELDARIAYLQYKLGAKPAREVRELYAERLKTEEAEKQFIESLRKSHPQYAGFRYPKPCSVEDARSCLKDNEVALLFTLGEEASYVFVLQKKTAKGDKAQGMEIIKLPGRKTINAHIGTLLSNSLLMNSSLAKDRAALLYDLVLKPVARYIANKDLLIIPDGSLGLLPFEMLVEGQTDEEDGHWLVEKHRVRYAPSLSALHLSRQAVVSRKKDQTRPLFAVADPIFDKDDPRLKGKTEPVPETQVTLASNQYSWVRGGKHFGRLPHSSLEAQAICKELGVPVTSALLAKDATETNIKKLSEQGDLRKARYVHFATHGIVGTHRGQPPALVLTQVGNDSKEQLGGPNDGYLTLPEVTFLDLNADLVVLSACETAKGRRARGEGVSGLARAFLYAGTKGVVCSLWSVDDAKTAKLMASMYFHLKRGRSSPDALRAAQLEMIKQGMAPFFWAPFITIGE